MRRAVPVAVTLAGLLLGVAACKSEPEPVAAVREDPKQFEYAATPPRAAEQYLNLFSRGSVVIARSGEFGLHSSALAAMDGIQGTFWATPPGDLRQWMIVELPARMRIAGARVNFTHFEPYAPASITVEGSTDGASFTPALSFEVKKDEWQPVRRADGVEVRFLRVTMDGTLSGANMSAIPELELAGEELEAFARPAISGVWILNGVKARFGQNGNTVRGIVELDPPMRINGGWDGRLIRFAWTRGGQYGLGLIALSGDGSHLSSVWWYDKSITYSRGDDWFGERTGDSPLPESTDDVAATFLKRFNTAPAYGFAFDEQGRLDAAASDEALASVTSLLGSGAKRAIRVFENRLSSPEQNLELSRKRVESIHAALLARGVNLSGVEFVPMGAQSRPIDEVGSDISREIHSRVVVEAKQEERK